VAGLGLIATLLVAAPAGLVGWRLMETDATVSTMESARQTTVDRAVIARAVEGLRGLARQIRFAPAGPGGDEVRRTALARLRVLATDPAWRRDLPASFGTALDSAATTAARLSALRAEQPPWSVRIAGALDRLRPFTRTGTPRSRWLMELHGVLTRAGTASAPALPVLETQARHLAARAIAAPGLPVGVQSGADPFAIHGAIAAALEVPALRRAALTGEAEADRLWQRLDTALGDASDGALTAAGAAVAETGDRLHGETDRLAAALLSLALAALAAAMLLARHMMVAHAFPLGRLSRRVVAAGHAPADIRGSGVRAAWSHLDHVIGTVDSDAETMRAMLDAESAARHDATTLSAALLGAAPEAAAGRNLSDASRALGGVLDAVRAQSTLALTEARLLTNPAGGRRMDVSSERAALAAHLISEACTVLTERVDEATRLVSALRLLSAPIGGTGAQGTPAPVSLDRVLRETAAILGPRLSDRGARLDLRCPRDLTVNAAPGVLTAVICYVIEAAMLRADGSSGGAAALSAVVLEASVGSDARVRLAIDDDAPAPSPEALDLLEPARTPHEGSGRPARLARALRGMPDAAALLLADGLARAALGGPLEAMEGPGRGMRVALALPLHAGGDSRDRDPPAGHGPSDADAADGADLPLLRTGVLRG
jgi:hypothetical protein